MEIKQIFGKKQKGRQDHCKLLETMYKNQCRKLVRKWNFTSNIMCGKEREVVADSMLLRLLPHSSGRWGACLLTPKR